MAGGHGGASSCARGGGDGADALTCPVVVAKDGAGPGEGFAGESAISDCTGLLCSDAPKFGEHGGDGITGARGTSATLVAGYPILDDEGMWSVPPGAVATSGASGGGGGGGGAAGLDLDGPSCGSVHFIDGGVGGGGGGGGCGGAAGGTGGAGGSSIAIAVVDADVEIRMSTIVRGRGGSGGDGGEGGRGGHGGAGGSGRAGQGAGAALAGEGGRGGDGGDGGGGAGGCAGSSIAIVHRGHGHVAKQQLTIEGGSVGAPGRGGNTGDVPATTTGIFDPLGGAEGCQGLLIDQLAL
jgi:hypothetical protein